MSSFLELLVPNLEEMVAETLWAVDLNIAHTPIVLPPTGYVLFSLPPPFLYEGIPIPCECRPNQGGETYTVILDRDRPAETAISMPAVLVTECRARFINLKNELFRVFDRLSHPQQQFAGSVYHGGFVISGGLGELLREHLERSDAERTARLAAGDPHRIGRDAQVRFGQPLPGRRRR